MPKQVDIQVLGASELCRALDSIAKEQPKIVRSALAQEIWNIKRSIAATVRNNKISKVKFDPNGRKGKGSWKGEALAKRDPITRTLYGPKGGGVLGKESSVDVASLRLMGGAGVEVGYKGSMARYIERWQSGVPNPIYQDMETAVKSVLYRLMCREGAFTGYPFGSRDEHEAFYRRLYQNPPALHTSPERPFMGKLADITKRDFVPSLLTLIQKRLDSKIATLDRNYNSQKMQKWAFKHV